VHVTMCFLLATITVMKLKALLYRLYKVESTSQKLSYKDNKVCRLLLFCSSTDDDKIVHENLPKIMQMV